MACTWQHQRAAPFQRFKKSIVPSVDTVEPFRHQFDVPDPPRQQPSPQAPAFRYFSLVKPLAIKSAGGACLVVHDLAYFVSNHVSLCSCHVAAPLVNKALVLFT
jgi:hypothetical protein